MKYTQQQVNILKNGGVAVIPVDTVYTIIGQALNKKTVERIYKIKGRTPTKPFIILISSLADLKLFNIKLEPKIKSFLENLWPAKVSVILPCPHRKFSYLHRGSSSLAFRLPAKPTLVKLIKKTGPLVGPSANPEGLETAKNVTHAKKYFTDQIDFYLSEGTIDSPPSTLIEIKNNKIKILRQGSWNIKQGSKIR